MFDSKRLVSNVRPFVRRMNIFKTKNFVIAVAVRLYKVVAGKMGVNGADKQVTTITAITITIITMTTTTLIDND
jgi:hypothetical protein